MKSKAILSVIILCLVAVNVFSQNGFSTVEIWQGELKGMRFKAKIDYKPDCAYTTPIIRATLHSIEVESFDYKGESYTQIDGISFPITVTGGYLEMSIDLDVGYHGNKRTYSLKKSHLSTSIEGTGYAMMADEFRFVDGEVTKLKEHLEVSGCSDLLSNNDYVNSHFNGTNGTILLGDEFVLEGGNFEYKNNSLHIYLANKVDEMLDKKEKAQEEAKKQNETEEQSKSEEQEDDKDSFIAQEKQKAEDKMKRYEAEQRIRENKQTSNNQVVSKEQRNNYQRQRQIQSEMIARQMEENHLRMQRLEAGTGRVLNNLSGYLNGIPRVNYSLSPITTAKTPAEAQMAYEHLKRSLKEQNRQISENYDKTMQSISNSKPQTKEEAGANLLLAVAATAHTISEKKKNNKKIQEAKEEKNRKFRQAANDLFKVYHQNTIAFKNQFIQAVTKEQENYYIKHLQYWNCCENDLNNRFSTSHTAWLDPRCAAPNTRQQPVLKSSYSSDTYYFAAKRKMKYANDVYSTDKILYGDFIDASKYFINKSLSKQSRNAKALALRSELRSDPLEAYMDVVAAKHLDQNNKEVNQLFNKKEELFLKALTTAIESSDMTFINRAVHEGLYRGKKIKDDYTASQYAILLDRSEIFKVFEEDFIRQGLNQEEKYFLFAINTNADAVMEHLIENRNISINSGNPKPVEIAFWKEKQSAFNVLMAHEASISDLEKEAKKNKAVEVKLVEMLVQGGIQTNNINFISKAAQFDAFNKSKQAHVIAEFIKRGNNHNLKYMLEKYDVKNSFSSTSLIHIAIQNDNPEALDLLLQLGYPKSKLDSKGLPPAHYLVDKRINIVKHSKNLSKLDFNQKDKKGIALLHKIVYNSGDRRMTRKILELESTNPNIQGPYDWTPLHFAVRENNYDLAQLLIKNGADKSLTDKWDQTPFDIAKDYRFNKIKKQLLQ